MNYKSKLINKTLQLDLESNLAENTTYSLYLNGAVKDITEGNDSLIQMYFLQVHSWIQTKFFSNQGCIHKSIG